MLKIDDIVIEGVQNLMYRPVHHSKRFRVVELQVDETQTTIMVFKVGFGVHG